MPHTLLMETKADDFSREFWERVDLVVKSKSLKFTDICREANIIYGTLMSNKIRKEYPSLENTYKLANYIGVTIDFLFNGDLIATEVEPSYSTKDPLYKILDEENDLKTLVWRIAQCSAIQLRAIKTMLASWGIGEYDAMGNSKAVVSS